MNQWLTDKGYAAQSDFNMKLDLVYNAYEDMIAEGSADLMDSAGVDYAEGTWGYEPVPAVESLRTVIAPAENQQ